MIVAGLCSLTLADRAPAEIVDLCTRAGLTHIEWWGKAHVPMGDVACARHVGALTRGAGLQISTYGSYYRVGEGDAQGVPFDAVLQTAVALSAPAIRVWAGSNGSEACSEHQREAVITDTLRIAELCAGAGVELVFEYHGGPMCFYINDAWWPLFERGVMGICLVNGLVVSVRCDWCILREIGV